MAIKWLNYLSKKYNIDIQHAENRGEYKIPSTKYKADGYCKQYNIVLDFYGDIFHGCTKCCNENDINPITKKRYGDLYNQTVKRENIIKSMGYNMVVLWECEWNRDYDHVNEHIEKLLK